MPLMSSSSDPSVEVQVKSIADTTGITETSAALETMAGKAQAHAATGMEAFEKFNATLGNVSKAAEKVGTSMSTYVTLPMVGVGYEAVKMAAGFQQQMEMLHTNAGTAQVDIAGLSQKVLDMAPAVGAGPTQLAEAFYHIASAGNGLWNTAKQLDILKIAAEGAAIGQANLDDTTYSLTSTMASNIKGSEDASKTMATLTAIVGAGDMKMQDLNAAIGTGFLGTASTFKISLASVGAALATLTDNGEHADAAATRLRMTWALMTSPSKQAAGILGDLGLNASDAALAADKMNTVFAKSGLTTTRLALDLQQPNGMNVALRDLQTHLEKAGLNAAETDAMLSKAFGGGRTDAAMLTLLQNLDRTDVKFKAINDSAGQFGEKWSQQQQTANQQFKDAWAGMESSLIRLGDTIMPAASKIMGELSHDIQDVSKWFSHLTDGEQSFILKTLAVAATVGPTLLILGKMGSAVSEVGDLFIKTSKALGLFQTASEAVSAAPEIAGLAAGAGGAEVAGVAGAAVAAPVAAGIGAALLPVAAVVGTAIAAAFVAKSVADTNKSNQAFHNQNVGLPGDSTLSSQATYNSNDAAKYAKLSDTAAKDASTLAEIQTYQAANDRKELDYLKGEQKQSQLNVDKTQDGTPARVKALKDLQAINEQVDQQQKIVNMDIATANTTLHQATDAAKQHTSAMRDLAQTTATVPNLEAALVYANKQVAASAGEVHARTLDQKLALDRYGASSPQYAQATANLTNAEIDLSNKKSISKGLQSDITNLERDAKDKRISLADKTKDLKNAQTDLNSALAREPHGSLVEQLLNHAGSDLKQWGKDIAGFFHGIHVPGFASGVQNFAGGLAMVGESGPELAYLPPGTNVYPHGNSGPGGGQQITIHQLVVQAPNNATMGTILASLDQDSINVGKGLTPARRA